MPEPLVVSVILNTNRREDTLECLAALSRGSYTNHQIIVLDNNSIDGSIQEIRARFPFLRVVPLRENLGYAGNNNVGILLALELGAEWVFILNEDTIVANDCLEKMVEAGENDQTVGVVGPLVYHHSEPEIIQTAGGMLTKTWDSIHLAQDELDRGQHTRREVDFISGCGMLVKRAAIDQVGTIDARFFYYKEETEWCLRIRKRGWKIIIEPKARMWHKGVQRNNQPKPHVTYYKTRNHLLMVSKHRAPITVRWRVWTQTLRTLTSWSIRPKWKHMRQHRDAMWRGIWDFIFRRWGNMNG